MKNLIILKGGSGSGKGTRVCQLMEYLKSQNNNCETVHYIHNNKKVSVGKFFPAFGIFIPGKYSISNKSGLTSWSGVDTLHGMFKTAEATRNIIKELCLEYSVKHLILEGEPMFLSDKYRPLFLDEFYNPETIIINYFQYDNREQYDARIMGRSGKKSGDSGWSRIKSYHTEYQTSLEEATQVNSALIHSCSIDEQPEEFVVRTLNLIYQDASSELRTSEPSIYEWCKANPMFRSVEGQDPLNKSNLW